MVSVMTEKSILRLSVIGSIYRRHAEYCLPNFKEWRVLVQLSRIISVSHDYYRPAAISFRHSPSSSYVPSLGHPQRHTLVHRDHQLSCVLCWTGSLYLVKNSHRILSFARWAFSEPISTPDGETIQWHLGRFDVLNLRFGLYPLPPCAMQISSSYPHYH